MRLQFMLSEIWIGLRRNLSIAVSVMLVTTVSVFGLSTLVYRYVDVHTTSLSRYAGRKFDACLPDEGRRM